MICPRCDNQGDLYKAKITQLQSTLYICDECEACWPEGTIINDDNFIDLSTYLEEHGTNYREAEIIIIEDSPRTAKLKSTDI